MMGGTLILLGKVGFELHYMTIANGSCGTSTLKAEEIAAIRLDEARNACAMIGAVHHPPICADIEIMYTDQFAKRLCAVVRDVQPDIILTQPTADYMEDHMISGRLAVTAAFCRGMKNYVTIPPRDHVSRDVTLYHALPYGLCDGLRRQIIPEMFVDITPVIEEKEQMLACHQSQKTWLDDSQGLDSYLHTMRNMSREVGERSGAFEYAEGWLRHSHLGFCDESADPLADALGERVSVGEGSDR
jgi:LmbE family N-acetylglucosaminyl deacetylase